MATLIFLATAACVLPARATGAENPAGKAKVVFICQRGQPVFGLYVFVDDRLGANLSGNTATEIEIDPGKHVFWYSFGSEQGRFNEFELVPGQTYYFEVKKDAFYSLLTGQAGEELLNQVKFRRSPKPRHIRKANKIIEKKYQGILEESQASAMFTADIEALPDPSFAAVKIPQYTPVRLTLLENISSSFNIAGEKVRFEVEEDVMIEEKLCIEKGTAVIGQVQTALGSEGLGKPGLIDLVISEIQTRSGANIPTIGRLVMSGVSRAPQVHVLNTSTGGGVLGGIVAGTMSSRIRGLDITKFTGEQLTVWVRFDTWVEPIATRAWPVNIDDSEAAAIVQRLKAEIPEGAIFASVTGTGYVDELLATDLLLSGLRDLKIGNDFAKPIREEFELTVFRNLATKDEETALICARETGGYFLRVFMDIGMNQVDKAKFELFGPDASNPIWSADIIRPLGLTPSGSMKALINKGARELLDGLQEIKPELIKN